MDMHRITVITYTLDSKYVNHSIEDRSIIGNCDKECVANKDLNIGDEI